MLWELGGISALEDVAVHFLKHFQVKLNLHSQRIFGEWRNVCVLVVFLLNKFNSTTQLCLRSTLIEFNIYLKLPWIHRGTISRWDNLSWIHHTSPGSPHQWSLCLPSDHSSPPEQVYSVVSPSLFQCLLLRISEGLPECLSWMIMLFQCDLRINTRFHRLRPVTGILWSN